MKYNNLDDRLVKIKLVKSMLSHVPFDGWTWLALEQGASEVKFKKNNTKHQRMETYKRLFDDVPIDFIEIFNQIIDETIEEKYISLEMKPERIPEKIKKIILMRLSCCLPYKEAIRSSLLITAFPKNSKKSFNILYKTINSIWRLAGDESTNFSFYTKRFSLGAVYTSTLLFWLNDNSLDQIDTGLFLNRRLLDISMIGKIKKPIKIFQNISKNIKSTKSNLDLKSIFDVIKNLNKIKKSPFGRHF